MEMFRALYQHIQDHANLPKLLPHPLLTQDIKPGASEFCITQGSETPGGGMLAAGLVVRRTYKGYIAVYYDLATNPGSMSPDEAKLVAALESFRWTAAAQVPGFVSFGHFDTDFALSEFPEKTGMPAVMSMITSFDLTLDLQTGVTYV